MSISSLRYFHFLFLFCAALLTSCGGGSSGDPDTPSSTGASITLQARSSQGTLQTSFTAGESFTLEIKARNDFGRAASGVTISVSTTLGSVAQTDVLTDSSGNASLTMLTTADLVGVATVTATGTIDSTDVTATRTLEINAATPQDPAVLTVSLLDETCTTQLNTQSAGNSFCALAQYTQDGVGIADEIVVFSTTLGTLAPVQALTNSSGVAQTLVTSTLDDVNAGQLTASIDTLSTNKNFQFTTPQASDMQLTLSVLDASCTSALNSATTGESLCLRAQLSTNELAIANEIIQFNAPLGTLRQATSLTNAQGIATAIIDSDGSILGAAEASATFSTISATSNYQFTSVAPPVTSGISVNLSMTVADATNNRFRSDEIAKLVATVLDVNSQPMANEIVTFTAEIGLLETATGLTNSEGVAQITLTGTDETLGAGVATATVSAVSDTLNYEILAANSVEQEIKLGHFNGDTFVEGVIGLTGAVTVNEDNNAILSAGGTLGLEVVVVDQDFNRFTSPTEINFTSTCTVGNQATLDETTTSVNGNAKSTYEDVSCAGPEGNQDTVVASVQVNGATVSATRGISLQAESAGAIEFVSADPESIVLRGTGGQGAQESSTLTFRVRGALGNPLAQQVVKFSLDTQVGDTRLEPEEGLTNSEGLVTARVISGTVPTPVRVTAEINPANADKITTQSDLISISTGLPDQNSMTLSTTQLNPEANAFSGVEATIRAYLSDSFNNPVPDGTTVNFTTEGGSIQPTCNTVNGSCTVTWTSQDPRPLDHRITILATAIGHETFFDTNGNNQFDNSDGGAITENPTTDSGLRRTQYYASGFIDHGEAWRDDDEDEVYSSGEIFIDYNNDQTRNEADGKFNGPQCNPDDTALCESSELSSKANVRRALRMVMSGSNARVAIMTGRESASSIRGYPFLDNYLLYTSSEVINDGVVSDGNFPVGNTGFDVTLNPGESINLSFSLADDSQKIVINDDPFCQGSNGQSVSIVDGNNDAIPDQPGQILPAATFIAITSTASSGQLLGTTNFALPNSIGTANRCLFGGLVLGTTLTNTNTPADDGDETSTGLVQISITYPTSNITEVHSISIQMLGD